MLPARVPHRHSPDIEDGPSTGLPGRPWALAVRADLVVTGPSGCTAPPVVLRIRGPSRVSLMGERFLVIEHPAVSGHRAPFQGKLLADRKHGAALAAESADGVSNRRLPGRMVARPLCFVHAQLPVQTEPRTPPRCGGPAPRRSRAKSAA